MPESCLMNLLDASCSPMMVKSSTVAENNKLMAYQAPSTNDGQISVVEDAVVTMLRPDAVARVWALRVDHNEPC